MICALGARTSEKRCVLLGALFQKAHDLDCILPGEVNFDHLVKMVSARFLYKKSYSLYIEMICNIYNMKLVSTLTP